VAVVKNNIIYNSGKQNDVAAWIADYRATPCNSDIVFDYNTLHAGSRSNVVTCNGIEFSNSHGYKGEPSFVNYIQGSVSSNLHLISSDQYARDKGADLSFLGITDFNFRADRDGFSRPQGSAWDIGAYEYVPGGDTTLPAAPTGLAVN